MLYDLNVPWSQTQNILELQKTLSFLSELGYETIALNHTISGPIPTQITNPVPETLHSTVPANTTILRRGTLLISDPAQNYRMSSLAAVYDIFALRPTTEKAFLAACGQDLSEHSIISLDLTIRQPFFFKPGPLMTAVRRGVKIEICYAQGTSAGSGARRNFISNVLEIIRATKGRGLLLSSEAKTALGVRPYADVINLMAVWGLGTERAKESMGVNPRGVVVNEKLKRTSFRGVVNVIYGGERVVDEADAKRKAEEDIGPQMSKRAKQRERVEARKAGLGPSSTGAGSKTSTEPGGISKTQAKKQRMKELREAKEAASSDSNPNTPGAVTSDVQTDTTRSPADG